MLFISLKGFIKNKQVLYAFMLGDQFFMLGLQWEITGIP